MLKKKKLYKLLSQHLDELDDGNSSILKTTYKVWDAIRPIFRIYIVE